MLCELLVSQNQKVVVKRGGICCLHFATHSAYMTLESVGMGQRPIERMWLHIAYIKAIDSCFTNLKIRNENK